MLAFFALLATTIIMPTLNVPPVSVYAATRTQAGMTLTTPLPSATTPVIPPTPTPTTPPTYQLTVRPDALSQDTRGCTAITPSDYSCSVTLIMTPALPATATVTWDAGISGGGILLGSDFPATVSIAGLACPSATTPITFTAIISISGVVLQSPTATDQWSCTIPPTATPSPTPTTAPPSPTATSTPVPGTTPSPTSGATPGATPSPSATGISTPTTIPTVCPSPVAGQASICTPTPRNVSAKSTKATRGTQGTQGTQNATPGASPTATQGGTIIGNSGGKNDPPPSTNGGPLFLVASLTLAALAFLLYLFAWGQGSIGERLLSLVLPISLIRRMRR